MKRYYLIEHIISYLSFVEKLIPICLDEEMHRKLLLEAPGENWPNNKTGTRTTCC